MVQSLKVKYFLPAIWKTSGPAICGPCFVVSGVILESKANYPRKHVFQNTSL